MTDAQPHMPPHAPVPRRPRKVFLLIGLVLAAALGVGLFTSLGTSNASTKAPHAGGPVPSFSGTNLNGAGTVDVSADAGPHPTPTVVLFFGNWCPGCHTELPPLAAAVTHQRAAGGALAKVRVVGVDSEDHVSDAKGFIKASGVTFPVAYDPATDILAGDFYFRGDPNAVFVNANGTINRIVQGDDLTPATFTADEKALIPSGT